MKNTGLEYEVIVQSIFQEIHNQEAVKNISVQRDVSLFGKSSVSHQIDVFWEFEHAGIRYQTVVQAKDWTSSVKKEQVLTFKAVLDDLPKQPRGIIVTSKGFQSGAKTFADSHGIELFQLKEEGEEVRLTFDQIFKLGFGSFANMRVNLDNQCLDVTHYEIKLSNLKIRLSEKWKKQKVKSLGSSVVENALQLTPNIDSQVFNSNFESTETFRDVLLNTLESSRESTMSGLENSKVVERPLVHTFSKPRYFKSSSKHVPFVRVQKINVDMTAKVGESYRIPFIKSGITSFILKNIISGTERKIGVPTSKINQQPIRD